GPVGGLDVLALVSNAIAPSDRVIRAHGHMVTPEQAVYRCVRDLGEATELEFVGNALSTPAQVGTQGECHLRCHARERKPSPRCLLLKAGHERPCAPFRPALVVTPEGALAAAEAQCTGVGG